MQTTDDKPRPVQLENRVEGWKLDLGGRFDVDDRLRGIRTRLEGEGLTVDVLAQPTSRALSAESYLDYGNRKIAGGVGGVRDAVRRTRVVRRRTIVDLSWVRPVLDGIPGDRNRYTEANVILDNQVVTIVAKSPEGMREAPTIVRALADSLVPIAPGGRGGAAGPGGQVIEEPPASPLPDATAAVAAEILHRGLRTELRIPPRQLLWGMYTPWVPFGEQGLAPQVALEERIGHRFELLMEYVRFDLPAAQIEENLGRAYEDGRVVLLSFQPYLPGGHEPLLPAFIEGRWDAEIRDHGKMIARLGDPVFVRFANEMNGDWVHWCAWWLSKDADLWILAWKRFRRLLLEEGAHNAIFVWNPHDRSYPDFKWNSAHVYWPGETEADWVGLTGYNNGVGTPGGVWRDFGEIYRPLVADYGARYPTKPFIITEFASHEAGGRKDEWIRAGLRSLAEDYPQIRAAVWWNAIDDTWLYEVGSSPAAFAAFAEAMRHPALARGAVRRLASSSRPPGGDRR